MTSQMTICKNPGREQCFCTVRRIRRCARPIAVFLVIAARAPGADPVISLVDPTPIELSPGVKTVRILLKFDGSTAPTLAPTPGGKIPILGIYLGGVQENVNSLSATWASQQPPLALDLTFNARPPTAAGTYDVFLELQPGVDTKIQLVHPSPKLQPMTTKLIVDRTYWFIGTETSTHPSLCLHESSNKSDLTLRDIGLVGNTVLNARPVGGAIAFSGAGIVIPHGGDKCVPYSLEGDFGIGTATGTMRVDSEELADAAGTFDFEVRGHVHWIYIGITIAIGLLLSYYLKVYLQQHLELEQARVDGLTLEEQVVQEETRHADSTFRQSYRPQLEALRQALKKGDPKAINDARAALDQQWRAQLQDLAKRRQAQTEELNKLSDVIGYDLPVPPSVGVVILNARADATQVRTLLDNDDLDGASHKCKQISLQLGDEILNNSLGWQRDVKDVLESLCSAPHGISAAVMGGFVKPAQDVSASLKRLDAGTQLTTPAQIQDALSSVRTELLQARQVTDYLANSVTKELATAKLTVSQQKPAGWGEDAFSGIESAVQQFSDFLRSAPSSPDPLQVPPVLDSVHRAWTDAVQQQLSSTPNAKVNAALDENRYLDAVQAAIDAKRTPLAEVRFEGSFGAAEEQFSSETPSPVPFAVPAFLPGNIASPPPVYSIRTILQSVGIPAPGLPTPLTDEEQLKRDKRLQSILVGIVLIIAGYGTQLNSFVGTFTDFSTLFFWAFGLDLTVDAISKAARKGS
jgi:hypothetical protein